MGGGTMQADLLRNNYLQLGVSACKAGALDQAAKLLAAGVEECDRMNLSDLGTAAMLYNLAVVYQKKGINAGVEVMLLRCLKLCRQIGGKNHATLPLVSRLLADYYYKTRKFASARYHFKQALRSKTLQPIEHLNYLMHLVEIENEAARHERVQQICQKIYSLQSENFVTTPDTSA